MSASAMSASTGHTSRPGRHAAPSVARTGRHAAPSARTKTAKLAVRIVPAVALAGALLAAPHLLDLGASSPNRLAGDVGAAHRSGTPHAKHLTIPSHIASPTPTGSFKSPESSKSATSEPRPKPRPKPKPKPAATTPTTSPAPTPTPTPTPTGPTCDGTTGLLPANYATIVSFLMSHGYTGLAAAGVAGNIYQESKGNPESVGTGGGGLIGWTPLPAGFVTGNPAADLETQLNELLTYNNHWSAYLPALNAATTATEAAYIYMTDFERPGIPAAYNRETAADDVAAACHL